MQKGITTIAAVSITIIVMLAMAAGGWYYMDKTAKEIKETNEEQMALLRAKINKLEIESSKTAESTYADESARESSSQSAAVDSDELICQQLFPGSVATMDLAEIGDTVCGVSNKNSQFAVGGQNQKVDESGGPGVGWVATKASGSWTIIQSTQDIYDCESLKKYNFPSSLLTSDKTCYNSSSGLVETYSN